MSSLVTIKKGEIIQSLTMDSAVNGGSKMPMGVTNESLSNYRFASYDSAMTLCKKSQLDFNRKAKDFFNDCAGAEFDAVDTGNIFVDRALKAIESRIYEAKRQLNNYRLLTRGRVNQTGGIGAKEVEWHARTMVGKADFHTPGAQDLNKVNAFMKAYTEKVHPLGIAFEFTWEFVYQQELANKFFQMMSVSPSFNAAVQFGLEAIRLLDNLIQKLSWYGDDTHGITGMLTNSLLADKDTAKVAFKAGGAVDADRLWTAKTWQEIYDDLGEMFVAPGQSTNQVDGATFDVTDIFLSDTRYNYANNKLHSQTTESVIAAFLRNNPGVMIHSCTQLRAANFTSGTLSGFEVALAFNASTEDVTDNYVPMPPTIWTTAPNLEGGMFTPVYAKKGSFVTRNPKAIAVRYAL